MRRPVSVKADCSCFFDSLVFLCRAATVATLPSALLESDSSLGASWAFSFQPVLAQKPHTDTRCKGLILHGWKTHWRLAQNQMFLEPKGGPPRDGPKFQALPIYDWFTSRPLRSRSIANPRVLASPLTSCSRFQGCSEVLRLHPSSPQSR